MAGVRVVVGATLICGVLALALPSAPLAASGERGGRGELTLSGRVGTLQFDRSTKAGVITFAGRPGATGVGSFGNREPRYLAMGYGCREHGGSLLWHVDHFDFCRTVFFLSAHTQKLVAFRSLSQSYAFRSARTGMATLGVQHATRGQAGNGCFPGFVFGSRHDHASVWGFVEGGREEYRKHHARIVGGHLRVLESESHRYPIGLLTC
jgi:hypothetical protein